ncbi:MAG: carboxypeptidase-like regulatory domain-containing protein [Nitrospirales bacterium]
MKKVFSCWLVSLGMILGVPWYGWAYEVVDVADGGTLKGSVDLIGEVPFPKAYNLITFPDPEYCGRISDGKGWRLLKDFMVNDENRIQGVVIVIEEVKAGKPFNLSIPKVEARDCQFHPFTTVVRNEHGIEVVNMDPVMHDIQAYETSSAHGTRVLFNSPLPFNERHERGNLMAHHQHVPGRSMVQQFQLNKGRKTFVMQCGFHAYMESWAMVVDNPYFALTNEDGAFEISGILPGTYQVRAWHPSVKKDHVQTVTIESHQTTEASFHMNSPRERWTAHTIQRPPRFTPAALGRPIEIEPLLERQRP